MKKSIQGRFRCIYCGCTFNLIDNEQDTYDQGFYELDPDCCDDCNCNQSFLDSWFDFFDLNSDPNEF